MTKFNERAFRCDSRTLQIEKIIIDAIGTAEILADDIEDNALREKVTDFLLIMSGRWRLFVDSIEEKE